VALVVGTEGVAAKLFRKGLVPPSNHLLNSVLMSVL